MRPFPLSPIFARWSRLVLALAGVALLAGCDWNFMRMDGPQSTIVVDGPVAASQRDLFYVTCWVTLVIFIIVGAVLAYATLKFRARNEADEKAEVPPQGHGNPLVEIGLIGASVLALVIIAIPTLNGIKYTYDVPAEEKANAYEITATGYQWWFKFEYPEQAQTRDPQGNPTAAGKLVTGNELVVPVGRAVKVNLRTVDVIHSFWVAKLAGKVDMIPNRANHLWFKADRPGNFSGQCAEYCGDSHAVMRFRVVALEQKDFDAWLAQQTQPARNVAPRTAGANAPRAQFAALRSFKTNEFGFTDAYSQNPLDAWRGKQAPEKDEDAELVAKGKTLFATKGCMACHTVRGHVENGIPFGGITAPDLTHIGARTTIAAGLLENNREQLQRWIHDPGAVKPGNKMALAYARTGPDGKPIDGLKLTPDDEIALVAYLESLK